MSKDDLTLSVSDLVKVVGTSPALEATISFPGMILSNYSLSFSINGVSYTRVTDYYGTAKLNINLPIGEYTCTVSFDGDEDFNPVSKTVTVTVTDKKNAWIIAQDYSKSYNSKGALSCALYDEHNYPMANAPISFTINGIKYNRTTDTSGKASLNINLRVGQYECVIQYDGTDEYKSVTRTVTVTVLADTKIVGSDVHKKSSELAVYTCTLYDCYGVPISGVNVKLTVNGVPYIRTTDGKGNALLNIRLREGTYTLKAEFTGTDDYLASNTVNTVYVVSDIQGITTHEPGMYTTPGPNRGFMASHIYLAITSAEKLKNGEYGSTNTYYIPDWEFRLSNDASSNKTAEDIYFTSYEITETDPRVKTARFTTDRYIDLTSGQQFVYITSPYHENFGGKILSVDYDKNSGLYTYQCQDGRRNYINKRRLKINANLTVYDVLEAAIALITFYDNAKVNMPLTETQRNNAPRALSGLHPLEDYKMKSSPVMTADNYLAKPCPPILSYDRVIDVIMNLAHYQQCPTDVYFTPDMICHVDPVDLDVWMNSGIRLVHSDLVQYKYGFDTTNVVTGVKVKGDINSRTGYYDDWEELKFFFGSNVAMVDQSTNSTSSTSSTSSSNSGIRTGSSIMSGKKTFVVGCDGGTSTARVRDVINALTAKGHTCINVGRGPSVVTNYGLKSASKGKIAIFICNGIDGGNFYDYIQSYYHYDHMILMYESNRATTDKWLTCNGMKNTKLKIDPRQGYGRVVYNSGVENYTAHQWCQKYSNKLSYVCGPLGCSWNTVLNNLVNGNFGSDGAATNVVNADSSNTTNNTTVVNETATYEKALEEVSKSIRDLLSFEIKIPLNHPLFKELHTNMMLFTELPNDFKLRNLEKIFKILPSYRVNRGVSYQVNRWYVEKIVTKMDKTGLFATVTLNPFPSSYSSYHNAVESYANAYNQAFNSSSDTTTSNGTTIITSKVGDKEQIFKEVAAICDKYRYCLGCGSSTYASMKSTGKGDCWSFAELVFTELKNRGVSTRIYQYATSAAGNHRSTAYLGSDGKWHDFPYREYCKASYYHSNWFYNFSGSLNGRVIKEYTGGKGL